MLPKGFSVDGWLVQSKAAVVTTNEYPALAETYARAGISIKLSRIPTYFLGKYVLNISLIVVMALCTLVFDNGSENVFCVPVACFMGIVRLAHSMCRHAATKCDSFSGELDVCAGRANASPGLQHSTRRLHGALLHHRVLRGLVSSSTTTNLLFFLFWREGGFFSTRLRAIKTRA
jgi:hypothetical protein